MLPPRDPDQLDIFDRLRLEFDLAEIEDEEGLLLAVPQEEIDNRLYDTADRVRLGSDFLKRFVAAGL